MDAEEEFNKQPPQSNQENATSPPPTEPLHDSGAEDSTSDIISEEPEVGDTFDLHELFDPEDQGSFASTAEAAAAEPASSVAEGSTAATSVRKRKRRRRRDAYVLVEELPEGVDFDEPVEVQKPTRIGRVLNFIVNVSLVIYFIAAILVIGNAAMTVIAVFNFPMPQEIYVNVSDLDKDVARLDFRVEMPHSFYTRFLSFEKDRMKPMTVEVYLPLPNQQFISVNELTEHDKICTLLFDDSSSHKKSQLSFDSSASNSIAVDGIELKLNPKFDAARLGLLLEDKKHPQRPKLFIIKPDLDLLVRPLMIPFTIPIQQAYYGALDGDPPPIPENYRGPTQAQVMTGFNFNPREVKFSTSADRKSVNIQVTQPLPKCLMGLAMHVEATIPPLDLDIYEFSLKNKLDKFSYETILKGAKKLATVNSKEFNFVEVMPIEEDEYRSGSNYLDLVVDLQPTNIDAVRDVLSAIRDARTDHLAFLLKTRSISGRDEAAAAAAKLKGSGDSVDFVTFMRGFMARYPYPQSDPDKLFPAFPENYDKSVDAALQVHFAGVTGSDELHFRVSANVFYVILHYGLPVSMLGGSLPEIKFNFVVKRAQSELDPSKSLGHIAATVRVANFSKELRNGESSAVNVDVFVKLHDAHLASLFAIKYLKAAAMDTPSFRHRFHGIAELDQVVGAEFVALNRQSDWISKLVDAFDMEFLFRPEGGPEIVYKASQLPVVPKSDDPSKQAAEMQQACQSRKAVRDELLRQFNVDTRDPRLLELTPEQEERLIREYISHCEFDDARMGELRPVFQRYLALCKNCPYSEGGAFAVLFNNHANVSVTSTPTSARIQLEAELHSLTTDSPVYEDRIIFTWVATEFELSSHGSGCLFALTLEQGGFGYLTQSGRLFKPAGVPSLLAANLSLQTTERNRGHFLSNWTAFFSALIEGTKQSQLVPVSVRVGASAAWRMAVPSAQLLAFEDESVSRAQPSSTKPGGFFDNLSRSTFNFTGYGAFTMLFNVIWPNPKQLSFGHKKGTIWNVCLSVPDTSVYLVSDVKKSDRGPVMVVSLRSSRYLARIVNNELESVFTFIDNAASRANLPESLLLERETSDLVLKQFKQFNFSTSAALVKAAEVEVKIVDFGRIVRFTDRIAENTRVNLGAGNPLEYQSQLGLEDEEIPLWSAWVSVLAAKWQVVLNDDEAIKAKLAKGPKVFDVSDRGVMKLATTISSKTPHRLTASVVFSLPKESRNSDGSDEQAAITEPFHHPVIRWGRTTVSFVDAHFDVKVSLSPGDIQIINNGEQVLFDALSEFRVDLDILMKKGGSNDFVKFSKNDSRSVRNWKKLIESSLAKGMHKSTVLSSATLRQLFYQLAKYARNSSSDGRPKSSSSILSRLIRTHSTVDYENNNGNSNEHYVQKGYASSENFFELFRVIAQKIYAPEPPDALPDPATKIDFSMLITFDPRHREDLSCIPKVLVPCFMTNFCSPWETDFAPSARATHFKHQPVPVQLHVRNVFQPLTAALAKGMATLLSVFHYRSYPPDFEWELVLLDEQVVGLEINGQALLSGRAKPFVMTRQAPIPYPNMPTKPAKLRHVNDSSDSDAEANDAMLDSADLNPRKVDSVFFSGSKSKPEYIDIFTIEGEALLPDSFGPTLRQMLSVMFVPGAVPFVGLHPPLLDPNRPEKDKLFHAPISVALTNAVMFVDAGSNGRHYVPSLASAFFAAYIEEVSSGGIDVHTPTTDSTVRMRHSLSSAKVMDLVAGRDISFSLWARFPWPMHPIGFNFGHAVNGLIRYKNRDVAAIRLAKHDFDGKTAKIRLDFSVNGQVSLWNKLNTGLALASTLGKNYLNSSSFFAGKFISWLSSCVPDLEAVLPQLTLTVLVNVNEDFRAESELTIPLKSLLGEDLHNASVAPERPTFPTTTSHVILENFTDHKDAVACIFNRQPDEELVTLHRKRWSQLSLARTRFFYFKNGAHLPNVPCRFALQLRTHQHRIICGALSYSRMLRVVFVYQQPLLKLKSIMGSPSPWTTSKKKCEYCVIETFAKLGQNSVYITKEARFVYPGRYAIYVQFKDRGELVKVENAEVYIANPR